MMSDFLEINERISQIIDLQCNGSQKKFAEIIGFSPQVIFNIVSGRKSKPSYDVLNAIKSSFVDLSSDWLLTGHGNMLKEDNEPLHIISNSRKTTDPNYDSQEIPLYDLEATAGLKELFASGSPARVLDTIKIPNLPKCDGAITVTGDSMYPLLKSGDIILYRETELENIFYGEMYLLSVQLDEWDEFITVKYIQKSEKGEEFVKLVSQNVHHQPKDIHLSKITALAMVKASIRINTMM